MTSIKSGGMLIAFSISFAMMISASDFHFQYANASQEQFTGETRSDIISAIKQAETQKRASELNYDEDRGPWKTITGTVQSVREVHTEISSINPPEHELAVILPDTGKIYDGLMAYSASTYITPGTLIVPVNSTEQKGQLAAAMDGKKLYAISSQDHEQKIGTWQFVGNVVTVHNLQPIPFNVNFTLIYRELDPSDINRIGTIQSTSSPLLGNGTEQLAVVIPPTENQYSGTLSFSASQNIQFIIFHGPLDTNDVKGKTTWSPDNGKTSYGLRFVDLGNDMGNLNFVGNGLVMRSTSGDPLTVSYAIAGGQ